MWLAPPYWLINRHAFARGAYPEAVAKIAPLEPRIVEVGGSILLVIGYKARWAALALAIFTLTAAIFFHNYWAVEAAEKMGQQINFWKNISMTGCMLMVFAHGPGRYSVDKG